MSDLSDILSDEAVDADLTVATNKKGLFQQLARRGAAHRPRAKTIVAASPSARRSARPASAAASPSRTARSRA
jgi:hypothetical protein